MFDFRIVVGRTLQPLLHRIEFRLPNEEEKVMSIKVTLYTIRALPDPAPSTNTAGLARGKDAAEDRKGIHEAGQRQK